MSDEEIRLDCLKLAFAVLDSIGREYGHTTVIDVAEKFFTFVEWGKEPPPSEAAQGY